MIEYSERAQQYARDIQAQYEKNKARRAEAQAAAEAEAARREARSLRGRLRRLFGRGRQGQ